MASFLNKMNVLQQKFMRASQTAHTGKSTGLSTEPSEFEAKYARLLQARDTLKKIHKVTEVYMKKAHGLAKQSKLVASAFGTPDDVQKRQGEELSTGLEDQSLLKAISEKVQLLDDTVRQRKKLEELRLIRDHHAQRLQQIKTKRMSTAAQSPDENKLRVEEAKWNAKLEHSQLEYDTLLGELNDALDFIDAEMSEDGPWALVSMELEAFRNAQSKAFRSIELLFAGAPTGSYQRDPEAEKAAVEAQKIAEEQEIKGDTSAERPKPPKAPGESDEEEEEEA